MNTESQWKIYFSFFMFTADLMPDNSDYTRVLVKHLKALSEMGYDGFDLHIAPPAANADPQLDVGSYRRLKEAFDEAGFKDKKFATNVGTTSIFDPTSPDPEQRKHALSYLRSRVDITAILGGESIESIMSGPFIYPYGAFPTVAGQPIWSDALQDWMKPRYEAARPILQELGEYASTKKVKLAIEPVKNWETPPPNMVSEVLRFLDGVKTSQCGVTLDTAQILLESQGPEAFEANVKRAVQTQRLHYVHISAPDRGEIRDSWIPWNLMLGTIQPVYKGPYLIEVFNAVPPFDSLMRMSRRRFWRPGEDAEEPDRPSAYAVAKTALETLRNQLARIGKT